MNRLLTLLVFLAASFTGIAQNAHLRILSLINFPDTAYQGVSYPVSFVLKNVGLAPFQGPLQVVLQTDTAFDILYFSQNPNFALFPNDTITLSANQGGTFGYQFQPQVFKPGNDVVVVWPYSTQMNVDYDSLYTAVYFVPLSAVAAGNSIEEGAIRAFPNPFSSRISIELPPGESVEQVRIYALDGKRILFEGRRADLPDLAFLRNGIYLLELRLTDDRIFYSRIVKTGD